jgi:translocation and assembly module TamB
MSRQRAKALIRLSLKWLNWTILLPSLLLCMLLAALLFSHAGLRLNIALAQMLVPGLSIGASQGSILGGHTLQQVRWQQGSNLVQLQQFSLRFNHRCLLQLALCTEQLQLDNLSISWQTAATEANNAQHNNHPPTTGTATSALWLPFPVTLSGLSVNQADIRVDGYRLNWQQLSTRLDAWGNKLQLTTPHWQDVQLTLPDSAADTGDSAGFNYTPPVLTNFSLPLQLFVDRFSLHNIVLQQQQQRYGLDRAYISLQWQQSELNLTQFDLYHPLGKVQSSARVNSSGRYPLSVQVSAHISEGELAGQQLQLSASGDLAALNVQVATSGPVAAEAEAELDLLSAALPHQLALNLDNLRWPLAEMRDDEQSAMYTLSRGELKLAGDIRQSALSGRVSLSSDTLPAMAIAFDGRLTAEQLVLSQLQLDTLGGQIQSPLTLNWQQGVHLAGQSRLRTIQPGMFWPEYPGELNGSLHYQAKLNQQNGWQLALDNIDISGKLRDYVLTVSGSAQADDATGKGDYRFSSPGLQISHADNLLRLAGSVQQAWDLALDLDISDISQSVHRAQGKLGGQFALTGPRQQPKLNGALTGQNIRYDQLRLQQLQLDSAVWQDVQQRWHADISLQAKRGRYQQHNLTQLTLRLTGSEQQHALRLELDAQQHQAQLTLDGSWQKNQWQGELQQAHISSLAGRWQLAAPAALSYQGAKQQLNVAAHCWQQDLASLCATETMQFSPAHASAKLALQQFELSSLAALLPANTNLQGAIDAGASLSWQQDKPLAANLHLSGAQGSFTQQLDTALTLGWQQLTANTEIRDNTLHNTLQLAFNQQASLAASVSLAYADASTKPLSGEIRLNRFAIDFLQPLLGELTELSGVLDTELALSGTLQQPLLHGQTRLSNTKVKGKLAPVDIDNAELQLDFSGSNARLNGQVSTPKGEVVLTGQADWQQLDNWLTQLNIKGDELRLQVPQASLQIAPDLVITASPELTRLSGSVRIPSARINIDDLPATAVELSDDTVLLDTNLTPQAVSNDSLFALQTDLNVQLGDRVRLSAFGLQTRLSGNLRVRQRPSQPLQLNGDVNLVDGTFRAYGQDLLIRKGKMNFNGPADQPFLNVEAIRNPANMEDDVIAGIRVTGPADDPNVVIFSEPAKSQASALAYLVMGRDLGGDSGNAGTAVTTSLIGMTLSSSSKVVGEIGEAFGLRDLTLDTAGAGDNSQVTVSGYLSRDLQLKYGYGIFNAVGEFTLRYRLMRRLYLEAVSGLDNAVDLLYKFEFD